MDKHKWNEWLKKINIERTSFWIDTKKINDKKIVLSPFNLFQIHDSYFVFMSTQGNTYFIESLKWNELFDSDNNPKEATFKISSKESSKYGIKLTLFEPPITKATKRNRTTKTTDPALQKSLNEWIQYINREGLQQELEEVSLKAGTIVEYSPFQFDEVKDNKLFLRTTNNEKIYIAIQVLPFYNASIQKQLDEGTNRSKYLLPLKTKEGYYRLVSEMSWKRYLEKNNDGLEGLRTSKSKTLVGHHTNNIWGTTITKEFENIELDEFQKQAHDLSIKSQFSIINGHAGTGKSVVVKMISNTLTKEGWIVTRLSPTGRAAQLINGKTIHSWLEPIIQKTGNNKYEIIGFSKLYMQEKECLIIDESSMIDGEIWKEVVRIFNNSKHIQEKKIILVGDEGQLEPVGEGKPFLSYIRGGKIPLTNLKTLHRNKDTKDLSIFAEHVRKTGRLDKTFVSPSIIYISKEEAFQRIINHSTQMIMPKRHDKDGSLEFNKELKNKMKIVSDEPSFYTLKFEHDPISGFWNKKNDTLVHINDKVIVIKNLWQWNVTNGTTGIFLGEEKIKLYNHITGRYSTNRDFYKFQNPETQKIFYLPKAQDTRSKIELAYAITIHKSQGSEYNSLILFLNNNYVDAKMLYTGVTRAKTQLYICNNKE